MMDLTIAMARGAKKMDEDTTFDFDRSKFMNASEANRCIRRQWFEKKKVEPEEEQDWGYARRGTHGEKYVIEALQKAGVDIICTGEEQVSLQDDKLSGTPDGIIWMNSNTVIVPEIKTIDPRTNTSKLPKEDHVVQNKICQYLVRTQMFSGVEDLKVIGTILYMEASNYSNVLQFDVDPYTEQDVKRWKRRANKVLKTRNVDNLDREGKVTGECRLCPFKKRCGVQGVTEPVSKGRSNRGSNLHSAADRLYEVKDQKKALEDEEKELKEQVKQELAKRKLTHTKVGNYDIFLTSVAGRTSLDREAVKKAGIDLSPFEKQGAPSERLEIKRVQ